MTDAKNEMKLKTHRIAKPCPSTSLRARQALRLRFLLRLGYAGHAGQASVELIVAIVLMLIVCTGLLHISRLARTSLFLQSVLREAAGTRAMESGAISEDAEYITDWDDGADDLRYTADDRPVLGSGSVSSTFLSLIDTSVNTAGDWQYVTDDTHLPSSMIQLHNVPMLQTAVEMTHEKERLYVPVESVIRQLVYDKDEIPIEEEVWMPLTGDLL